MPFHGTTMQASQNPPWPIPCHQIHWREPRLPQDIHLPVNPVPAITGHTPARFVLSPRAPGPATRQNDGCIHATA
jgi:hypothetical protein